MLFLLLAAASGGRLAAQETATPKDGDGIYTFLRRHKRNGDEYVKEFIELNKGKLGKNNALILGVRYTLPPLKDKETESALLPQPAQSAPPASSGTKGKKRKEPLFGKKEAEFEVISNELKGARFYVVCGHGGPDPGAIGKLEGRELHEDEYAYDISLRLAKCLMMRGADVHIIIQDKNDGIRDDRILKNSKTETCMGDAIPLNQTARLKQRCEKINALEKKHKPAYSRAIFIHIDSRSQHKRLDVFFYHSKSTASRQLAQTMRKTFSEKYGRSQPGRGFTGTVEQRNLYVLNNATPPSLYVELGNLQNSADQQRFILSNNRQALANWLCEGFIRDYKASKK